MASHGYPISVVRGRRVQKVRDDDRGRTQARVGVPEETPLTEDLRTGGPSTMNSPGSKGRVCATRRIRVSKPGPQRHGPPPARVRLTAVAADDLPPIPPGALSPSREIELDFVVAHELATGSAAARRLWRSFGSEPSELPTVIRQEPRIGQERTTDVEARADGRRLLIEDKAVGGHFELGQVESYRRERSSTTKTCLVAPKSFLGAHEEEANQFDDRVSIEELAEALMNLPSSDPVAEIAASYHYRAGLLRNCAQRQRYAGNPNEQVQQFGDDYRRLAAEMTDGDLKVGGFQGEGNRRVRLLSGPHEFWHNLAPKGGTGQLDFYLQDPGVDSQGLRDLIAALPEDRALPLGWEPADAAKRPVLRHEVPTIEDIDGAIPPVAAVQPILVEVIDLVRVLHHWLARGGFERPATAIDRHLGAAARLARQVGESALADTIEALRAR